eukprot:365892-Chlamydomonas_euryale.AAC.2
MAGTQHTHGRHPTHAWQAHNPRMAGTQPAHGRHPIRAWQAPTPRMAGTQLTHGRHPTHAWQAPNTQRSRHGQYAPVESQSEPGLQGAYPQGGVLVLSAA